MSFCHALPPACTLNEVNKECQQVSAVLAAGMQDWIDFGVICALLLLNAVVSFGQEYQAGNIVNRLKETLALKATVTRNGHVMEIDAEEVVPGDVVHLEEVSPSSASGSLMQQCTDFFTGHNHSG